MRNGLKLGLDYQIMRSFAQETSQGVRVTLEKELDGKRSFASLLPNLDSSRPALGIRLDGGYMYDRFGSYDLVWYLAIALGVFAATVNLMVREAPISRELAHA